MIKKVFMILILLSIYVTGCESPQSSGNEKTEEYGDISITLPGGNTERSLSGIPTSDDISSYELKLSNETLDYSSLKSGLPGETVAFTSIPVAEGYSLSVKAFDSENNLIFTGLTEDISVNAGEENVVDVEMEYVTGELDVNISIPDGFDQGLDASDGDSENGILIEWLAASDATEYIVLRSDQIDGTYSQIGTTTELSYNDPLSTTLKQGIPFYYKVQAVTPEGTITGPIDDGYIAISALIDITGITPTFYNAARIDYEKVNYQSNFVYQYYRSESIDGEFTKISEQNHFGRPYNDSTAIPGKYYYYKIRIKSSTHDIYSDFTPVVSSYSLLHPVTCATDNNATRVQITWDAEDNVETYLIRRSSNQTDQLSYVTIGEVSGTDPLIFEDTTGLASTTYWYMVIGESPDGVRSYFDFMSAAAGGRF